MTLVGEPLDAISTKYKELLEEEPGGVYLALTAPNQNDVESQLELNDITFTSIG